MLMSPELISQFKDLITKSTLKVIIFDLETSPSKFWGWGTGEQYVDAKNLVEGTETKIITAQYMYAGDKKAKFLEWDLHGKQGGNDSSLVEELVPLLNEADIVIGQNSKAFDIKVLQERAKVLRLPPVNIDFMLDTLTHSRGSFKTMSHRLDYRSKQYGLGGKMKMEMQDWIDIVEGRTSPRKKMVPYGLKDVEDTNKLFWLDLPYYNLPKATINKVIKLTTGYNTKPDTAKITKTPKAFCNHCAKERQSRYDVKVVKGKIKCNRCKRIS